MRRSNWLIIAAAALLLGAGSAAASFKMVPETPSGEATPPVLTAPQTLPPFVAAEEAKLPPVPATDEIGKVLTRLIADQLPNLPLDIYRFDEAMRRDCNEQRGNEPMVRALIITSAEASDTSTTANDIDLIVAALKIRGVPEAAITVLDGSKLKVKLDRAKLIEGFNNALACVKSGDQLILHFSGFSAHALAWRPSTRFMPIIERESVIAEFCKVEKRRCDDWAKQEPVNAIFRAAFEHFPAIVLAVSNVAEAYDHRKELTGLWDLELANFVTQIRNRGADVFAFLDTSYASAYRLGDLQAAAQQDRNWQAHGSNSGPDLIEQPNQSDRIVPLYRDAGGFAAFYAAGPEGEAYVIKSGDKQVGAFSLALSHTLQTESTPDVATLAHGIVRTVATGNLTEKKSGDEPEFEASSSSLAVLAPRKPLEANSDDIEIIEPVGTRGGSALLLPEDGPVRIVARFKRPAEIEHAMIHDRIVPVERGGTFSAEIPALERTETISVSVLTHQRQYVTRKISVAPPAALSQALAPGRRFALLIGNTNYLDKSFQRLSTPQVDVKAVAETLTRDFGFVTSLPVQDDKEISLILLDATADQIYASFVALTRELGAADQLLIFYAGHGIFEKETKTAYWVPVDARPGYYHSFLATDDITRELQRMKARNILIVADSCYAGAMMRNSEQGPPASNADRVQTLVKLARQKNRMLLTSGGNEPVLDEGGKGHSIFANAFIAVLENIQFDIFSGLDLYSIVLPVVSGKAKQEPKYNFLRESGHEGGDFVFVRTRRPEAAAQK